MKVIQLRGTNGSGKTTAVRQFISRGNFVEESVKIRGTRVVYNIDHDRNIIVLGRYRDGIATGGVDGLITNKEALADSVLFLCRELKPKFLIFEGIVYGVTFRFANELYRALRARKIEYIAVCLVPPLDISFERLAERNNNKAVDYMSVQQKYFTSLRAVEMMQSAGVPCKVIDTSTIAYADMWKCIGDET